MKKVVVASKNPVKIGAVEEAFGLMFPDEKFVFEGVSVNSGVADQPKSDEETLRGAMNRAKGAKELVADGDFFVGLEGGVDCFYGEMFTFAWMAVLSKGGVWGRAKTVMYAIPVAVRDGIDSGLEMGDANDVIFKSDSCKTQGGIIGFLTDDAIDRRGEYVHAVMLALSPFKNPHLF